MSKSKVRKVGADCSVRFEGFTYVPSNEASADLLRPWIGQQVYVVPQNTQENAIFVYTAKWNRSMFYAKVRGGKFIARLHEKPEHARRRIEENNRAVEAMEVEQA